MKRPVLKVVAHEERAESVFKEFDGDINPRWVAFFSEVKRLAECARQRSKSDIEPDKIEERDAA